MRMLRVLHDLFYQPMAEGGFFLLEELQNIFPSLEELIEVHCECRAAALLHSPHAHPGAQCGLPKRLPWAACSSPVLALHPRTPELTFKGPVLVVKNHKAGGVGKGGDRHTSPRDQTPPPPSSQPALHTISQAPTEHLLSCPLPTALFLDRLMKRRQDSGYLIEEIGDVLLAQVRAPPALESRPREARSQAFAT